MILSLKTAAILLAGTTSLVSALPKITRHGRYLYQEDGTRFFIKGIAYQEQGEVEVTPDNPFGEPSSFVDPLALGNDCARDVPKLQELGVNAVRVYSVDSRLNHDACMNAFNAAGIYTIIDLSLPLNGSIDRLQPSWSSNLLDLYIGTIDVFAKYENVLAYNIGNEVVTAEITTVAPYVKAAARDTKAYLKSKNSNILVGYAGIDGNSAFSPVLANFLTCDVDGKNSDSTAIDLYGLNTYRWCAGDSISAYSGINNDFANYNVAAYFSEYGCNKVTPRTWTEVPALFGADMAKTWSGGVAFSYFPARSADGDFGMVTVNGNTVTTSADFDNLKTVYTAVQFQTTPSRDSAGTSSYGACPAASSGFTASTTLPPTPNDAACLCLQNALSCRYTPTRSDYTRAVGELIGTACTLLDGTSQNCLEIGSNTTGATPFYGRLSGCDPTIKLSYVMSKYYESQSRAANACSFGGNGTVNAAAPTSSNAADAAASSCISNPAAIFTPSSSATAGGGGSGNNNGGSNGGSGNNNNGAETKAFIGLGAMALLAFGSAVMTLF